ncbi:MAG: NAD(P)/FAD-dependent oxidoreductase [Anaerolineales bacterium]|nr:NAD(P)/FAD-dependent oxidoreductase [Anaerolineales bacterium]
MRIDVLIVGAGPAGLSTAMHLIQGDPSRRQNILVLDKATHPRPKLCGGGVTYFGLQHLRGLGLPLPLPIPHWQVEKAILKYRHRKIPVRGKPLFAVFDRPAFDHYLAEQARQMGVQLLENEGVRAVEVAADHVKVVTAKKTYQAQVVVGADSNTGVVRPVVRSRDKGQKTARQVARTLEVKSPARLPSPRFSQNSAIFDFTYLRNDLQGYFWDFPSLVAGVPVHNQGIYDSRLTPNRPRANLPALLKKGQASTGSQQGDGTIETTPIHWFSLNHPISRERILWVGDAAGVEVAFGEGIGPALAYGKVAAAEIRDAFQSHDFGFKHYRRRVLRSPLGRYLLTRWLLAGYVYSLGQKPGFMPALWTAGQVLAALWQPRRLD